MHRWKKKLLLLLCYLFCFNLKLAMYSHGRKVSQDPFRFYFFIYLPSILNIQCTVVDEKKGVNCFSYVMYLFSVLNRLIYRTFQLPNTAFCYVSYCNKNLVKSKDFREKKQNTLEVNASCSTLTCTIPLPIVATSGPFTMSNP